jgi:hypothetical protein
LSQARWTIRGSGIDLNKSLIGEELIRHDKEVLPRMLYIGLDPGEGELGKIVGAPDPGRDCCINSHERNPLVTPEAERASGSEEYERKTPEMDRAHRLIRLPRNRAGVVRRAGDVSHRSIPLEAIREKEIPRFVLNITPETPHLEVEHCGEVATKSAIKCPTIDLAVESRK